MSNPAKVEFFKDIRGQTRWRILRSGRIIATSGEGYSRASKARTTLVNLLSAIRLGRFKIT